jgi:hypothetical protein
MKKLFILLIPFIFILSGCLTIKNVKENAESYKNKYVFVRCQIMQKFTIPFIKLNIYRIADTTDSFLLVSDKEYKENQIIRTAGKLIRIDHEQDMKLVKAFDDIVELYLLSKGYVNKTTKVVVKPVIDFFYNISKMVKITFFMLEK